MNLEAKRLHDLVHSTEDAAAAARRALGQFQSTCHHVLKPLVDAPPIGFLAAENEDQPDEEWAWHVCIICAANIPARIVGS